MFILNTLRKTSIQLAKSAETTAESHIINQVRELDDIIESLSTAPNLTIKPPVKGIRPTERVMQSIKTVYQTRFKKDIPKPLADIISQNARSVYAESIVKNAAFMAERADSHYRLESLLESTTNGYRESLDRLYLHLIDAKPKNRNVLSMTGSKYKIVLPAVALTAGTGSYIFYRAMIKSICDNNLTSGCIATDSLGKKCKILSSTCNPAFRTVGPALKECNIKKNETSCSEWNQDVDRSICKNCTNNVGMKTVECIEPPSVGDILSDALSMGFDDINTTVSSIWTFFDIVLKYAHYGFLLLIAIVLSFVYNKLKFITSSFIGTAEEYNRAP